MKHKLEGLLENKKVKDILAATKLKELIHLKEDPIEKKKHTLVFVLAIVGAVAMVALIAYLVYKFTTPDYLDDFDDDFDDFEEDFGLDSDADKASDKTAAE